MARTTKETLNYFIDAIRNLPGIGDVFQCTEHSYTITTQDGKEIDTLLFDTRRELYFQLRSFVIGYRAGIKHESPNV